MSGRFSDALPDLAVAEDDFLPAGISVFGGEDAVGFRAQVPGLIGETGKKGAGRGFGAPEVEGFENQAAAALGGGECNQGGNDRAVAVAPKRALG